MTDDDNTGKPLPPPPSGFCSWLDYAVFELDTRTAWHEFLFSNELALRKFDRDDIQRAAESELRQLREKAGMPDTYPKPK